MLRADEGFQLGAGPAHGTTAVVDLSGRSDDAVIAGQATLGQKALAGGVEVGELLAAEAGGLAAHRNGISTEQKTKIRQCMTLPFDRIF